MANQRRLPPGKYALLQIEDLSGGVDLRHSPTLMQPSRARVLRNWSLREPGALTTYPGFLAFSATSLGATRPQGGQRIYLSGGAFTLVAYGGSVYKPTDAGVWGSAVLSGLNATNQIHFCHDRDLVAVYDSANVPKKTTNGTTWTQLGISAPAAKPTLALKAGGSLVDTNVYEVSYAYRDNSLAYIGNESPVETITVAVATGKTITATVARSADPQVSHICIYARDVTAGESARRKVTTIANPVAATVDYDITANDWDANDEAFSDHSVPPALGFGVYWKYRWWAFDGTIKNRLRFSQIYSSQAWPANYYLDLPFERGDEGSALQAQGDTLVCFGTSSKPYLVIGQTSLDFEVRPAFGAISGAFGPRSVDLVESGIIHASSSGCYLFDGATDRLLSYDIDPGWQDFVARSAVADLAAIAICYHEPLKELHITVPRLFPTGSPGEWILDLNRTRLQANPAWTATTRGIGGYISWNGNETTLGNRGRLFSWSNAAGTMSEEVTGTTANGSDLVCEYEGPTNTTGLLVARWIDAYGSCMPAAGVFGVETSIDGVPQGSQTIDIGATLSAYGVDEYGSGNYGGADLMQFPMMLPLGAEGGAAKVSAKYTGQALFKFYSYALGVVPEVAPRGM